MARQFPFLGRRKNAARKVQEKVAFFGARDALFGLRVVVLFPSPVRCGVVVGSRIRLVCGREQRDVKEKGRCDMKSTTLFEEEGAEVRVDKKSAEKTSITT